MPLDDFERLVKDMRDSQKRYHQHENIKDMMIMLENEKLVDNYLRSRTNSIKEIIND